MATSQKLGVLLLLCTGGFKLWECTTDLIETLRREIQDGRLSFRGKHVLEVRKAALSLPLHPMWPPSEAVSEAVMKACIPTMWSLPDVRCTLARWTETDT
jgi:hypothetical protein